MKRIIFALMCLILMSSFVSAADSEDIIIINKQPNPIYNLGDSINIPIVIFSDKLLKGELKTELICNGKVIKSYNEDISISPPEITEIRNTKIINLIKKTIGFSKGTCFVRFKLNDYPKTTEEFKISDLLTINLKSGQGEFEPEEEIIIEGEVTKENGEPVKGFIELKLLTGNVSQENFLETVNNGFFRFEITLPKETAAGPYLISLNVYEKDLAGEITNKGFLDYTITIKQVPTSLEVLPEISAVEPGTNLRVKAILHDQTGINIDGTIAIITIKDYNNKILYQSEKTTNEFLEFFVEHNQAPSNWTAFAVSTQLDGKTTITIKEKKEVKYELANKTLTITNVGNVLYNDTVFIKIGEEIREIMAYLEVDESKKYTLSAPEGEYEVGVVNEEGSEVIGRVLLTGKTVSIEEARSVISKVFNPFIWIFVIAICGFVAFMFFKKGHKKSFIGYIKSKRDSWKNKKKDRLSEFGRQSNTLEIKSRGILSLSIKGDKQDSSIVCLKIKNLKEIKKGGAKEIINKIIGSAEEQKSIFYQDSDYLFFILAPVITKTFRNEITAITIAKNIINNLANYNKLAQQKIEFGVSLNHGTIVAKKEGEKLKFMSLKTFIPKAKKIATISDQEIFLTDEMNNRLLSVGGVRTEKQVKQNIIYYTIKQLRDTKGDAKFLGSFLSRLERDNKK